MEKAPGSGKRKEKAITFGLDPAPATLPWRESRLASTPIEAHVHVGDKGGPIRAEIHNVSRSGLLLVLDQAIPVGAAVKVEMTGMIAVGEIRHCLPKGGNSFAAGMRIDSIHKRV